jgi:hypothetical protein
MEKPYCFVIQPFDNEKENKYHKRFIDVFSPAISEAGYEPYRVAEITESNQNVWFEVGFARALGKKVVYVSEPKEKYPFDIQHRSIIQYKVSSPSDFTDLKGKITSKIIALMSNMTENELARQQESSRVHIDGLDVVEILTMRLIMDSDHGYFGYRIRQELKELNMDAIAAWFAINKLSEKNFIELVRDYDGSECYYLTGKARKWAMANESAFAENNIVHYRSVFYKTNTSKNKIKDPFDDDLKKITMMES